MTPAIVVLILEALVKYGPAAAREIVALFQKANPTVEDWNNVFVAVDKNYEDYVKPKP